MLFNPTHLTQHISLQTYLINLLSLSPKEKL